jgi:hypothetical protein
MRGYHVAGGVGITNPQAACEVGSTTYALTPTGLYTVTQDGGIARIAAVSSLILGRWRGTLASVHLAYDQESKCIVMHNASLYETCLLWLETSRVTLMADTRFLFCKEGPTPLNGQIAGGIQQRACFFQQINTDTPTWRVFNLDNRREKRINFSGHPDHGFPMIMTMHPIGVEGRQVVHTSFTSGSDLLVEGDGIAGGAVQLEGCQVYVAKAANPLLVGKKATIKAFTTGDPATLTLESSDGGNLWGLAPGDSVFISPVYCLSLGWAVGLIASDGTPDASLRDKFRERQVATIVPAFSDVSGVPTLTEAATTGGNGYSPLARFAGIIYEANATSPSVRGFPTETDATDRRSLVDKAAILGAPIVPPNGFRGANLFPGVETYVPNLDYQLLSFRVEGRILDTNRPGRALTGGVAS